MSSEKTQKDSVIIWQENEDMGVGEPAVLISDYSDVICIHQEDRYVNLNYDSLDEIIKVLKEMKKKRKS